MWYVCSRVILQRLSWNWSSVLSTNIVEVLFSVLKYSTHQYSAEPKFNLQHRPKSNIPHCNNKTLRNCEKNSVMMHSIIICYTTAIRHFYLALYFECSGKISDIKHHDVGGKVLKHLQCWYVDKFTKSKFRFEMFMNFIMTESQKT